MFSSTNKKSHLSYLPCAKAPNADPDAGTHSSESLSFSWSSEMDMTPTGLDALNGVIQELSKLNSTLRMATERRIRAFNLMVEQTERTERTELNIRKLAQDLLQTQDNDLDDDSMVAMLNIFSKESIDLPRTYIDLKRDSLRKLWIKRTLQKHGHEPASPK